MNASLLFFLNILSFPLWTCSIKFRVMDGMIIWKSFKCAHSAPSKTPSKFFTRIRKKSVASWAYLKSKRTDISNILHASRVSPFKPRSYATSSNLISSTSLGINLTKLALSFREAFLIIRTSPKALPMLVTSCLNLSRKVKFPFPRVPSFLIPLLTFSALS